LKRFSVKIISFVAASSNSGKTTLIEKVVRILKSKGLTVAVVKHASKGFDLDRPGKDSWRFREAGADAVLLIGPEGYALQKRSARIPEQAEIARLVGEADIVIREGFKHGAGAKIEVFRTGVSGAQPLCLTDRTFLALVSDERIDAGIPWYHIDDAAGVAEHLATKL
jgi:molybdopterin-guanine dinucleotide biosynthesis protein B